MDEGFEFVAMGRALLREPDLVNRIEKDADPVPVHPLQQVHAHQLHRHPLPGGRGPPPAAPTGARPPGYAESGG